MAMPLPAIESHKGNNNINNNNNNNNNNNIDINDNNSESSLLLAAFMGCFVEETSEWSETTAEHCNSNNKDNNNNTINSNNNNNNENMELDESIQQVYDRRYVLSTLRRVLQYLIHNGDATRARLELEEMLETVCESHWQRIPYMKYTLAPHNNNINDINNNNNNNNNIHITKERERRYRMLFLRDVSGLSQSKIRVMEETVLLPCVWIYIVYYIVCKQCPLSIWEIQSKRYKWVYDFFFHQSLQITPVRTQQTLWNTNTNNNTINSINMNSNSSRDAVDLHNTTTDSTISLITLRQRLTELLSHFYSSYNTRHILLFVDIYHAWLMRDYHTIVNNTKKQQQHQEEEEIGELLLLREEESSSLLLWVISQVLWFIQAWRLISTRNIAQAAVRDEIEKNIHFRNYKDEVVQDNDIIFHLSTSDSSLLLSSLSSLSSSSSLSLSSITRTEEEEVSLIISPQLPQPLLERIYHIFSQGLFDKNNNNNNEDIYKPMDLKDNSFISSNSLNCWQDVFLILLRVWLRAKQYTDAGNMNNARDLLLHIIDSLYNTESDGIILTSSTSSSSMANTCTVKEEEEEETSTVVNICRNRKYIKITVHLLLFQWIQQLFLVNCAALADTQTLLYFLQRVQRPLSITEVLYIASCPTLGAGGVHSHVLTSYALLLFNSNNNNNNNMNNNNNDNNNNNMETVESIQNTMASLDYLPLPVQIQLLGHRIWQKRRLLVHELPRRQEEDRMYSKRRLFVQWELLHLCEVIVHRVCGLFGSLELSFTDFAPHRIIFDAITIACDVQEDMLRGAAEPLRDVSVSLSSLSSTSLMNSSPSIHNMNESINTNNTNNINISNINNNSMRSMGNRNSESKTNMITSEEVPVCTNETPESTFPRDGGGGFISSRLNRYDKKNDNSKCNDDDDTDNDRTNNSWLAVNFASRTQYPSSQESFNHSLSNTNTNYTTIATTPQELYWLARHNTIQWMTLLEENYSHLSLSLQICRMRIAAAAFDKSTLLLARELLKTFHNNALAKAHGAMALFASLHIIPAERCIRETLQQYPHSVEIQRLHCVICGNDGIINNMRRYSNNEQDTTRIKLLKEKIDPIYIYRYRGVLPLRYAISKHGGIIPYISIFLTFLCTLFLALSLMLHLRDSKTTEYTNHNISEILDSNSSNNRNSSNSNSNSSTDTEECRWSFKLPFILPVYLGFGILIYGIFAAVIVPFFAEKKKKNKKKNKKNTWNIISRFLQILMYHACLINDVSNRLVFCLRGLPLLSLVILCQLVVNNAIRLGMTKEDSCDDDNSKNNNNNYNNNKKSSIYCYNDCYRIFTEWSMLALLLILLLLVINILFYGRIWCILRSYNVIKGTLPTFITVFLIDFIFLIINFPFLLFSSVVLEPFMFLTTIIFSIIPTCLPVKIGELCFLCEHYPSVPDDGLLTPQALNSNENNSVSLNSLSLFCNYMTSELYKRLLKSLPPIQWLQIQTYDCPILCAHVLSRPRVINNKEISFSLYLTISTIIIRCLTELASRGVGCCLLLNSLFYWRTHRHPWQSVSAVQAALLRESCLAIFPEIPKIPKMPEVSFTHNCEPVMDENQISNNHLTCITPLQRGKATSTVPYG